MNAKFIVFVLTQPEIEPKSRFAAADILSTPLSLFETKLWGAVEPGSAKRESGHRRKYGV